jgi:hypothetical protein
MFSRKKQSTPTPYTTYTPVAPQLPQAPPLEYIGITLAEMEAFELVLLHGDECSRRDRPGTLGSGPGRSSDLIARLYQSAGAASVLQSDPGLARVPVRKSDFMYLEWAVTDIERHRGNPQTAREGRQLLNRFNALLGQQRAVIHLGGTAAFSSDAPASATPTARELPTQESL